MIDPPRERAATAAVARSGVSRAFPSFSLLRTLSFVHSTIYAALLLCWLAPGLAPETLVFGWAHGILWIAMSLLVIVAARQRTVPFWLAVTVAVIGGIGPFAGTIGFVVEARRRGLVRAGESLL
jgi:hypothetical protein